MREILSLLLILALFLPCALAETPQGIDLALTSTYGDGLSLRMTAGLGETPFCSLTLPSGQIDLAFSPDKGLCVQSGGQWAHLLVEGHPAADHAAQAAGWALPVGGAGAVGGGCQQDA